MKEQPIFPFYKYAEHFHIGEYILKDQGGKFVQMELFATEDDDLIVRKISDGLLEEVYGDPIIWGVLEKKELEKSVWLNRFYFLPSFARLYFLNGDTVAFNYMIQFIRKWIEENPREGNSDSKYNWYDMQVAWRAINLSWCYYLCENELEESDKELIKNSLKEHSDVLLSHFGEQSLNEFNHQAHGALAMIYLGVLFPDFDNSAKLIETSLRILDHHMDYAFYTDGGNVEQMFGYYPFETQLFRDAYLLCVKNNIAVSDKFEPMLQKMAAFITMVAQPDHTMPPVNDSYPVPVESILYTLKDLPYSKDPIERKSNFFTDTQIGVMHGNAKNASWYLLANPAKRIGTHAHAGRLAFISWFKQQAVFVESGCCTYDNPQLVSWYRTSKAHNTVLIDGQSDILTSTDRLWAPERLTANHISEWIEQKDFIFCRMLSPQNEEVNRGVRWSRDLAIVQDKFMLIHDCFQSPDEHAFESYFHFPPVKVTGMKDKAILFEGEEKLKIIPGDTSMLDSLSIDDFLVSVEGEGVNAPVAKYCFRGKGTIHFVLLCSADPDAKLKIKQKDTAEGTALKLKAEKTETVILMRNSEADTLSAFGYKTSNLFEVHCVQGK